MSPWLCLFVDLLTPCSILSKVMQHDDLDILSVITSLSRSVKEIKKLSTTSLDVWSTYATTLVKCTRNDGATIYHSHIIHSPHPYMQLNDHIVLCHHSRQLLMITNDLLMLATTKQY